MHWEKDDVTFNIVDLRSQGEKMLNVRVERKRIQCPFSILFHAPAFASSA